MFKQLKSRKYDWKIDKKRFYISLDELKLPKTKKKTLKEKYGLNKTKKRFF